MKKYSELKREEEIVDVEKQETTEVVEKKAGFDIKETGRKIIQNKYVKAIGKGVALGTAGVIGFILGDHFGHYNRLDDLDVEVLDSDSEEIPEDSADE